MRRLLVPLLVFAAAIVADRARWPWLVGDALSGATSWRTLQDAPWAARALAALILLLAWRLRRGRIAWATLAIALVAEAAVAINALNASATVALAVAALLLPLNLAVVAWLREWWVVGQTGLWRFAALGGQALVLVWVSTNPEAASTINGLLAVVESWLQGLIEPLPVGLPDGTVLLAMVLGLSAAVALTAFVKSRSPLDAGLTVTVAACGVALWPLAVDEPARRYYLTVAILILGAALIENAFRLAFVDALTALPARRALEERLDQLGRSYAIAMLDLDHFKKFNDRHGHEVGDQVLRLVATRLVKVGGGGEAFRYGGEEFTIVFAGLSAAAAQPHLETLRRDIGGRAFTVRSPARTTKKSVKRSSAAVRKQLKVTVSIGVAERSERNVSPEQVIKAADRALYKAKKAGRNRVAVASG